MSIEIIGKQFVAEYYKQFDDQRTRKDVCNLYHATDSCLSFEGQQFQGAQNIMAKYNSMSLESLMRQFTTVDVQPLVDGGILIQVIGQLKTHSENDKVMAFTQTFVLRSIDNNYFLFNDIFRLVLHDA